MRYPSIALVLMVVVSTPLFAQASRGGPPTIQPSPGPRPTPRHPDTSPAPIVLEDQWTTALTRRDAQMFDRLLAPDRQPSQPGPQPTEGRQGRRGEKLTGRLRAGGDSVAQVKVGKLYQFNQSFGAWLQGGYGAGEPLVISRQRIAFLDDKRLHFLRELGERALFQVVEVEPL